MGNELLYTDEIKICYFMRSALQVPSSFVSLSCPEFRCILIGDVWVVGIQQLGSVEHGYIQILELYNC